MRNLIIAIVIFVVGCKKSGVVSDIPPPIAQGTCLVDRYEGAAALQQTCTYVGYLWSCKREEKTTHFVLTCDRGGEAKGERPAIPPPPPQAVGSGSAVP